MFSDTYQKELRMRPFNASDGIIRTDDDDDQKEFIHLIQLNMSKQTICDSWCRFDFLYSNFPIKCHKR